MIRRALCLTLFAACAAPKTSAPPPEPARKKTTAKPAPKPKELEGGTVSLKVDAALVADALAKAFEQRLKSAGFRMAADNGARFFVTFRLKEGMTAAPPPGKEIARVSYVAYVAEQGIRFEQHSGEEQGLGKTLDEALDKALEAVAEKVTPVLIAEMLQRLDGAHQTTR